MPMCRSITIDLQCNKSLNSCEARVTLLAPATLRLASAVASDIPRQTSSQPVSTQYDIDTPLTASARRYTGPFSRSRLERLIGPFKSAPLGSVPKSSGDSKLRLIQDLSFPRDDPERESVNSGINSNDFICEWGTFAELTGMVMDAPAGTEAATLDVDAAYRRIPIHPSQQAHFVVQWEGVFWIDHADTLNTSLNM
jgi:hypothetical protein